MLRADKGFILMAELIAIVIFGVSLLALTKVLSTSMTSADQSVQMSQANWMIQDILVRMSINKSALRNNEYSKTKNTFSCVTPAVLNSTRDLQRVFCNNPVIKNTDWAIRCADVPGDAQLCSVNSEITVEIKWPNIATDNELSEISYQTRI